MLGLKPEHRGVPSATDDGVTPDQLRQEFTLWMELIQKLARAGDLCFRDRFGLEATGPVDFSFLSTSELKSKAHLFKLPDRKPVEFLLGFATRSERTTETAGAISTASMTEAEKVDEALEIASRQAKGEFLLAEVAQVLADMRATDGKLMLDRLKQSHREGKLPVREWGTEAPIPNDGLVRPWQHLVLARDVDTMLERHWQASYRFEQHAIGAAEAVLQAHGIVPASPGTPEKPASLVRAPSSPDGPEPMVKEEIALLFDQIKWSTEKWRKELAAPPQWLRPARMALGERGRGGAPSTWNPIELASILISRKDASEAEITEAFKAKQYLDGAKAWLPKWKEYLVSLQWGK